MITLNDITTYKDAMTMVIFFEEFPTSSKNSNDS